MSWNIKVEYINDKTGECHAVKAMVSDEAVKNSNLDELDLAFQKITDQLILQVRDEKK